MNSVVAVPEAIRMYGDTSATMASTVAAAGAVDLAGNLAALVPVFGLVGQEFLVAFAVAQANHSFAVAQLAAVHAATAVAAHSGAAAYESADSQAGASMHAIGNAV